jgi:hypothetical protein
LQAFFAKRAEAAAGTSASAAAAAAEAAQQVLAKSGGDVNMDAKGKDEAEDAAKRRRLGEAAA